MVKIVLTLINKLRILATVLLLIATISAPGRLSQQETRAMETTTTTQPVQTTQTTTTTDNFGHSSLLGATANFVWTVVSFPFRVVGDVIGEIV